MVYTVSFVCGGKTFYKDVDATSEREAIRMVKKYVYYSVSFGSGKKYKIVSVKKIY